MNKTECHALSQSVDSSQSGNDQLMMHEDVTCFYKSRRYVSSLIHNSASYSNPTSQVVMEVKIQNLSFESYVLATRDPEFDNLFKPELPSAPSKPIPGEECSTVVPHESQLLPICPKQDCQQEQPKERNCTRPQSTAHNRPVRTMVFWNSKFKKPPTEKKCNRRSEAYYSKSKDEVLHRQHENNSQQARPKHKRPCFIKGCNIETTHLKKHVIVRHLPRFVSMKSDLTSEEQMKQYESLLMSVAHDLGCLSLQGLLRLVIKRKWYPFGGNFAISEEDLKLMTDFQYWICGHEDRKPSSISPPSNVTTLMDTQLFAGQSGPSTGDEQAGQKSKPEIQILYLGSI